MEENFDSYNEEEDYAAAVNRFEKMLSNNQNYFFDVEEFEDLINYYLDINDHEKAEKALNFSLNQHPDSVTLKIKLAEFLASTYKPNKALEILSSVEHIEPFNPDIHIIKGQIYNQIRQHNKAIEAYNKALKFITDSNEKNTLKMQIAFEYENLLQLDKAIAIFKEILKENPENETVLYDIAFCYNLNDANEESIRFLNEFLDENPYSFVAWYNLGVCYHNAELYEKSVEAHDFAITIKED